jgi:hypothetical protein
VESRLVHLNRNNPKILRPKFSKDSKGFKEESERRPTLSVREREFLDRLNNLFGRWRRSLEELEEDIRNLRNLFVMIG